MRVIRGKYKGRFLTGHKIAGTRPTMDRVKESVFSMLQGDIPGYLDKIENKIIKNEDTFKINWI